MTNGNKPAFTEAIKQKKLLLMKIGLIA